MKEIEAFFKDKDITIMGLGLLGRQINIIKFLHKHGAKLTVTDLKTKEELTPALEELKNLEGIRYVLGEHRLEDFRDKDMIIRAANVPMNSPYIKEAKKNNIPVELDASLFAKLTPKELVMVGVTGTRGKSTVAQMIYEALKDSSKNTFLAGNVKGLATLPLLEEVQPNDIVVLELDSWQLQGFRESGISPHIAVFTTFFPDHLNYYKGDMKKYFEDKAAIFENQSQDDYLVLGKQAVDSFDKYLSSKPKAHTIMADENSLPANLTLRIPGDHNKYNAGLALEVLKVLGLNEEEAVSSIKEFESMPGRLEFVGSVKGLKVYNDTNSTTPDALLAAINSFPKEKIILIAGGTDKDLDYSAITNDVDKVKKLYLLSGSATEKMKKNINTDFEESKNIENLVKKAFQNAEEGDVLLFSPGGSSFELFKNEYDRGERFIEIIKEYAKG